MRETVLIDAVHEMIDKSPSVTSLEVYSLFFCDKQGRNGSQ